ncbi:MAG: glycosyltransferase [Lachnospiraceae bacterium]|nr:glycosyltransferase [Lachnospiraceae bacterium]
MEQIKNYLSRFLKLNKILLLSSCEEFVLLKKWLGDNHKAEIIYETMEEISCADDIDAVIFDYGRGQELLLKQEISCGYYIGRMKKEEDCFGLWEQLRRRGKTIYIEKDKGLSFEEITADRPKSEILFWEKGECDTELSVIIPVYNVAEYLPDCIKSLTAWQAPYVEFLFINDGSSDYSAAIIEECRQQDQRIRLINKENGGCASARNRGLEEAKGRYVGFVDSDDVIHETMLEKLFSRALLGGYEVSYCGYSELYEKTAPIPVKNDCLAFPYTEGTWRPDKVWLLAIKTRVAIWRCLYKKEFLKKENIVFREELQRFDDLPFRTEVFFKAKSAVCIPEYLYYYRLGRPGQDVSCRDKRLFVHFPIFEILDKMTDQLQDGKRRDLLQIIKIHTHGYALSKMEKKYRREYSRLAGKQLDRNMGYFRTLCLILMYTGKSHIGWYTAMKLKGKILTDKKG